MRCKMQVMIGFLLIMFGSGCVPSAGQPEDLDPLQEAAVNITVLDKAGDPVPDVALRYRLDENGFAVTHVVGAPTPEATATPRPINWQSAPCLDQDQNGVCKTFQAQLACDAFYVVEAQHSSYQFEMAYVTTSLVNGRCQADTPELILQEYQTGKICTAIAVAAINLTVVDENGNKLISARAAYRVNDGEIEVMRAADFCRDGEICGGSFSGGDEQPGHYEIWAEADGYLPATTTVDVGMDAEGCHVAAQVITIALQPGESQDAQATPFCQERDVPSMYIEVMNEAQRPEPWATVTYQIDGGDWQSPTCVNAEACSIFQAGLDQPGTFIIRAEKEGFQTALVVSDVPLHPNGCHVVTQRPQIILKPEE